MCTLAGCGAVRIRWKLASFPAAPPTWTRRTLPLQQLGKSTFDQVFPRNLLLSAEMERSSRRTREDDTRPASSVEPGVQCHAPWSGQAPEGGRLRDDRERSLMSPDTTVATKVEAQLEERLPVFGGYEEQLNGRPLSVDRNRSANGSGEFVVNRFRLIQVLL